ncbi:MAG TPA: extracellular solute-binding protein, partial [Levilinea sp.]|nr:extracellular solute-binding protein [Levilinea sp.]
MHTKFLKFFSVVLLAAMLLGACAPAPAAAPAEPQIIRETVEVVQTKVVEMEVPVEVQVPFAVQSVLYNSYNGDPVPRAFDEKIVTMWNERNPEMPVEHSIIAHEDFKQAIRAYLTADPAPDVLTWFAGNRARFFIDRGLILNLDDMWQANNFDEVFAPGFQALASHQGSKYFLPTSYYWWAIYYRPSLFEQAGI